MSADGVAESNPVRALGLGSTGVLDEEAHLGARGVLGVDRDVDTVLLGEGHGLAHRVEHPRAVLLELGLDVDV